MKKKLLIAFGVLVVLLIAAVVIVGMSLGGIIKTGVERVGPTITKTDVKLGSADLSVLSGTGTLKNFLLGNPEGFKTPSAIKAASVSVGVQPKSLFSDKIHVTHVRVEGAEITFEGTLGTANNLSKILENVKGPPAASAPASKPGPGNPGGAAGTSPAGATSKPETASNKLQVDEFTITGAKVRLSMTLLQGTAATASIPDIKLTNLGTGPDGITAAELTEIVISKLTQETLKAVEKFVTDFGKNATEVLTKTANEKLDAVKKTGAEKLDKAAKGLGDLLNRK